MTEPEPECKPREDTCPHCGAAGFHYDASAFRYDLELPPKPWYGFDPYCDPDYHGAWVCDSCGKIV